MTNDQQPSWRKPAGVFLILFIIGLWAWGVTMILEYLGAVPLWAQIGIYAVAGIAWIVPLRPLLLWMETGKWRE